MPNDNPDWTQSTSITAGTVTIKTAIVTVGGGQLTSPASGVAVQPTSAQLTSAQFGAGYDGAVTITADTTLTRITQYTTLTVNAGVTLFTHGYQVLAKTSAVIKGTVTCSATGATPGPAGTLGGGQAGTTGVGKAPTGTIGGGAGSAATLDGTAGNAGGARGALPPAVPTAAVLADKTVSGGASGGGIPPTNYDVHNTYTAARTSSGRMTFTRDPGPSPFSLIVTTGTVGSPYTLTHGVYVSDDTGSEVVAVTVNEFGWYAGVTFSHIISAGLVGPARATRTGVPGTQWITLVSPTGASSTAPVPPPGMTTVFTGWRLQKTYYRGAVYAVGTVPGGTWAYDGHTVAGLWVPFYARIPKLLAGGGGGVIYLASPKITLGTTAKIKCVGGNGGTAGIDKAGNGGGGTIICACYEFSGKFDQLTVKGGTNGGSPGGTGSTVVLATGG